MRYITELKQVEGLGNGHSGTEHFVQQRLSAIALVILLPFFLIFVAPLIGEDASVVREAFADSFWVGLVAGATTIAVGIHLMQGLQVAIEDYVQGFARVALLALMRIGTAVLVLAALWAIVLISLS